jgi:inhibitor of cysteine peptidase
VEVVVLAKSRLILAFLFLLALLSLAACGSGKSGSSDTSGDASGSSESDLSGDATSDQQIPDSLDLTAKDNGGTFVIQVGGTIVLKLEANPSTGYSWEMNDPDPEQSLLAQVGEPVFKADNPDAAGAGGIETFTFNAADPGEMTVSLVYASLGANEAPTEAFEFDLTVK